MRAMRMLVLALLAAVSVVAFAGCGDDSSTTAGGAESTTTGHMGMTTEAAAGVTSPAADLRVTLDELLGEHALLAMFATQKGYDGAPDFEAIAGALDQNGVDLSEAIGSVYGDEAGTKFLDGPLLWRDHIGFFVDYTVGLAKKDKAAQKEAVGNLMGYNAAFANFLATATELPEPALKDAVAEHITGLKGQIDAYAAKDYPAAYTNVRDAYAHMFMTGDTLAGGIAAQDPDTFSSEGATMSAADLRVTLGRLLGEHAYLAMLATQKGYSGAADFDEIAAALDQNSADVGAAIGSVYGDEAGQQFLDGEFLWRDHIGFFVDYTVGLAEKDKAAQDKAVGNLMGYNAASAKFLADATGLPQQALQDGLETHLMQLKGQIDAYAAGDYEQAYALAREAYAHMYELGTTLAGAIVAQSPDKFSR